MLKCALFEQITCPYTVKCGPPRWNAVEFQINIAMDREPSEMVRKRINIIWETLMSDPIIIIK